MSPRADDYGTQLAAERRRFDNCTEVHNLPPIFHYWSEKYLRPKLRELGFEGAVEFFVGPLRLQCVKAGSERRGARFISIGSGNADFEIDLCRRLRGAGHDNFVIDCLDINEAMQDRGSQAARAAGVAGNLNPVVGDFNSWQPSHKYDAVVAVHSLHHVVRLEGLFDGIREGLRPTGCMIISDIIGRNGHLRWPEALDILQEFWPYLPPSYRFNHQLHRYEAMFEDWDCSTGEFEGVRAQDILPLLLERFHFQYFLPYANLIDPFVDRSFGHNFDASTEWDREFIDRVHQRDEKELKKGTITPTHMFAILTVEDSGVAKWSAAMNPTSCVRRPDVVRRDGAPKRVHDVASLYKWKSWPHDPQLELEIACERLAVCEAKASDFWDELLWARKEIEKLSTDQVLELQKDLQARTEWALDLDRQLADRTAWALDLDRELKARKAVPERLFNWQLLKRYLRSKLPIRAV